MSAVPAVLNARVTIDVLNAGRETVLKAKKPMSVIRPPPTAAAAIPTRVARRVKRSTLYSTVGDIDDVAGDSVMHLVSHTPWT